MINILANIPNLVFILLIAVNTSYLTFLTTKGGLTDNRFSHFWDKLTFRGRRVLFSLIIMAVLLLMQEWSSSLRNSRNDLLTAIQQNSRDSLIAIGIKKGVDSATKKLYEDISIAFAKQEFRLDTVKIEVEKIRDSARNIINNFSQADPVLLVPGSGVKIKDSIENIYTIEFESNDAGTSNFVINTFVLTEYLDNSTDFSKLDLFTKHLSIPKNGKWAASIKKGNKKEVLRIYFYVFGSYTTLDGSKSYKIDEVYEYISNTNHTSNLLNPKRDEIIRKISKELIKE